MVAFCNDYMYMIHLSKFWLNNTFMVAFCNDYMYMIHLSKFWLNYRIQGHFNPFTPKRSPFDE